MSNIKKAGPLPISKVLKELGEAGAETGIKQTVKRVTRDIGEDIATGLARGEGRTLLRAIPKNLASAFGKSEYNRILRFFTAIDDKFLKQVLGQDEFLQFDEAIKRGILRSAPEIEKEAVEKGIKSAGGGRNFLKQILQGGDESSFQSMKQTLTKGGVAKNVDKELTKLFKKNPEIQKRMLSRSMREKAMQAMWKGTGLAVGISTTYSLLISLWDYLFESTDNANQAVTNVVSELKDLITEGATTKAQSPELIVNIRTAMVQLIRLNKDLRSAAISSRMKRAKSKEEMPQFVSFYKNQFDAKVPAIKEIVGNIEMVFNNIVPLMGEYDASWTESVTSLGVGGSANRAKQVLVSIEQAKPLLEVFVVEFEQAKNRLDSSLAKQPVTSGRKLMLVAQEMEKKSPDSDLAEDEKYSELAKKKIKEKDPGVIAKVLSPVVKIIPKDTLVWIATNPTKFNALLASIDAALFRTGAVITQKIVESLATKGVPAAMAVIGKGTSAAVSKGVGVAAGSVAVFTSAIAGLDVGHYFGKLFFGGGGTLEGETSQLLNYLEQADGGVKGSEWSKLNRRLQTKLAGSAYIIGKGIKELEANKITGTQLTQDNIKKIYNCNNAISQVAQGIKNIEEVTNILKQSYTRDLYIKHGEGIAGAFGRGVDATVNFVSTFGGLLGERELGENPTGFANIYNAMMDFVEEIDGLLLEIKIQMLPYRNNLEKIKGVLEQTQPLIAEYSEEIKTGKV